MIRVIATDFGFEMISTMATVYSDLQHERIHSVWRIESHPKLAVRKFSPEVSQILDKVPCKPFQVALGYPDTEIHIEPSLDVDTWYNTTFHMFDSSAKLRTAFDALCNRG